jgi:GNAT superfamily N-acetyltransferase
LNKPEVVEEELNEVGWWSHWSDVSQIGPDAFILTSPEFPEPLFNHAILLDSSSDSGSLLGSMLARFQERRTDPSFFVIEDPSFLSFEDKLKAKGFAVSDRLLVMTSSSSPPLRGRGVELTLANSRIKEWATAYLLSFYGELRLLAKVEAAAATAVTDEGTSLYVASRNGAPVGEMALYCRGGVLGAYCVGTLPKHRRTGVASAMLELARAKASDQNLTLALQTFASDGEEGFYVRRGFRREYQKLVFTRGK